MTIYIPESGFSAAEARFLAAQNGLTCAESADLSLACNEPAHTLCADKHAAAEFFTVHDLPQPHAFPAGSEPYIVKPANGSCGRGIWSTEDFCEAGGGINAGFLVQEELRGPIFSVAIVGHAGKVTVCPAVKLILDDRYDRRGAEYPAENAEAAEELGRRLGEALALEGVMELKCVLSGGKAVIVSLNEGVGPLAATALHYGAKCDPIAALLALKDGREATFDAKPCRVLLEVDGRMCGLREADKTGALSYADGSVTDGRVRLLIEN